MCDEAVRIEPRSFEFVPEHLKTQGMCIRVVKEGLWQLYSVPDWFAVLQEMCREDFDNYDYLIGWRNAYKKRKAQEAQIKKELMPIAWHPSRWWNWCMSEDEK